MEQLVIDATLGEFLKLILFGLVAYLIPRLVSIGARTADALIDYIRARLDDAAEARIEAGIAFVVKAAEQSGLNGTISSKGTEKLRFALNMLLTYLARFNIHISEEEAVARIEAAIREGLQNADITIIEEVIEAEIHPA